MSDTNERNRDTFPEAASIISEKLVELEQQRRECVADIDYNLNLIKSRVSDEMSLSFWREWVKLTNGKELQKIEGHIQRLKRLQGVSAGVGGSIETSRDRIQSARSVPIENILDQKLRKTGRSLLGLCPLHNEKTPSFHVYPASNSFYCFGCNQGGDVITLLRSLHSLSFWEAVTYLLKIK